MLKQKKNNILYRLLKNILSLFLLVTIFYLGYIFYLLPFPSASVVVQPNGGLGNQMFQYAAAYSLAKKTESKLFIVIDKKSEEIGNKNSSDRNFALSIFNIPREQIIYLNKLNKYFLELHNNLVTSGGQEKFSNLKKKVAKLFRVYYVNDANYFEYYRQKKNKKTLFLNDYFESEVFFKDYKNEILSLYTLKDSTDLSFKNSIQKVSQDNSVCVHIRKGDMSTSGYMYYLPIDYQKEAIKLTKEIINAPRFYIFSDMPEIAKAEFKNENNIEYINGSQKEDFQLMSNCKTNIIANSSYSWWAAYLNKSKEHLVIAPYPKHNDYFFVNIFLDDRIRFQKRSLYANYSYPENWVMLEYNKLNLFDFAKENLNDENDIKLIEKLYKSREFGIFSGDSEPLKLCKGKGEFLRNFCYINKNSNSLTLVTMFYEAIADNKKLDNIKSFLQNPINLVIYTDKINADFVKKHRKNLPTKIIVKESNQLEYNEICNEMQKFKIHDRGDNNKQKNHCLGFNKASLVKEAVINDYFNNDYYLWYDLGQDYADISVLLNDYPKTEDKLSLFMLQDFTHVELINKYINNDSLRLNDQLILGSKASWIVFANIWNSQLLGLRNMHFYVKNEQIIIGNLAILYPKFFSLIYPKTYYYTNY